MPTRAAAAPAATSPPVAAPAAPATARAPSPRAVRAPPVSTAAAVSAPAAATSAAEAKPSVASASATCCKTNRSMSCAAWRSTSAVQGLHFAGPSDNLGGRHLVRWGGQSRGAPRDAQRAVQPVAAAPQGQHRLVLRNAAAAAAAAASGITVSAAWMPLSRSRPPRVGGLGGSSPSGPGRDRCPRHPSSLSGRKDGLVNSLGGRGKGTPS